MIKRVECPVCHRKIGTRAGRIVRHVCVAEGRPSGPGRPAIDPYVRAVRLSRRTRGGHLIWTGYLMNGTPALQVSQPGRRRTPNGGGRTSVTVRRIVWRHHKGEPPAGAQVIATCTQPQRCIAIEHLATVGQARGSGRRTEVHASV